MTNSLNPLNWLNSAQNWFSKTERSSGFRPYLIFLIIHIGFTIIVFTFFNTFDQLKTFTVNTLYLSVVSFIILFAIKCFQDPNFCRSEKHIENVKRLNFMEQKGDTAPSLTTASNVELIAKPNNNNENQPEK